MNVRIELSDRDEQIAYLTEQLDACKRYAAHLRVVK